VTLDAQVLEVMDAVLWDKPRWEGWDWRSDETKTAQWEDDKEITSCCATWRSAAWNEAVHSVGKPMPGDSAPSVAENDVDGATEHALVAVENAPGLAGGAGVCAADIRALPLRQRCGGKEACAKQRQLRSWCLSQHPVVYDVDLTNVWHWQSLLRSLPDSLMSSLLGNSSVASFVFRLLPHAPDTNYLARDPGERDVVELLRADDVAMHMHFHKDGKMDAPIQVWPSVFPGTGLPDVPQSGPMYRLQTPCTLDEICREQPYASGKIGKNQVQMTLIAIMSSSCGGL